MDSVELIINLAIIGLLIPTIVYAYRLNKNLTILRQNQNSLAKLVEALNDATHKAENSIPKLKSVTEHSSEDLKEVVDSAKTLKDDLLFINERADNLADRLETVIRDGRNIKESSPLSHEPASQGFEKKSFFGRDHKKTASNDLDIADTRSEAEMELLKALRSIK